MQHPLPQHPLGEMTFNPVARRGDPDWRVMYLGAGDSGSGDQRDSRRINPQRLDTLVGKILRIVPDLREHTATSTVSENGRYRIPNDNPFTTLEGARKEIWAYGLRNPHRLIWDVDPARPKEPRLLAFHIGLVSWETVVVIRKGANYGWPLREGTQARSLEGHGADPAGRHDSDPDLGHRHARHGQADLSGAAVPAPAGRRRRHRQRLHLSRQADPGAARTSSCSATSPPAGSGTPIAPSCSPPTMATPATVAPIHEMDTGLRGLVDQAYRARGGKGAELPGAAADLRPRARGPAVRGRRRRRALRPDEARRHDPEGRGREAIDRARAHDDRRGTRRADADRRAPRDRRCRRPAAAAMTNPVPSTPASIAAGKTAYDATCAACHGKQAQGAVKAKRRRSRSSRNRAASSRRTSPTPSGTTARATARSIAVMKRGVPPTMMPGFDGAVSDTDLWNIVNYLRTLAPRK